MTREDEIFRKIEQGDSGGLDELVSLYYPEILRYCRWHTPDQATAEDAAQETFLKAVRHFDRYVHKGRFKAFLYQIAANTCVDMWRRKKPEALSEELPEELAYTEQEFDRAEQKADLALLVEKLPEKQREVVLLRFAQDLTLRETADVLGLPLRTVQSRLRAALKYLKKILKEGGRTYAE